jgi:hypothetical protein
MRLYELYLNYYVNVCHNKSDNEKFEELLQFYLV